MFDTYADIFAERALAYHSAMEAAPHARDAEFRCVLEPLDDLPGGTVCDMPAGGGYLARYLRPDHDYVAVDPASDFVAFASKAASQIVRAELVDVPLPSGSLDHVVSLAGLHHEPDLGRVFREMHRLVRPGGRIVIADVEHGTAPALFLNGFVARTNPMGHDGRFLDANTPQLLEEAGFSILHDAVVLTRWTFESTGAAARFAAQLFGTENATPKEVEDALSAEIGFTKEGSQVRLNWSLRRIVCTPDRGA